jgi:sulfoxide reductase heme-binding subunit YedZ
MRIPAFAVISMKTLKLTVFFACLAPLGWLIWAIFTGNLSANPLDDITDTTGRWTLRFLLITLAISPLRQLTGWNSAIRLRRMLGLYAFFYGSLHFITYLWFDMFFDFAEVLKDIPQRPFITAGFIGFILMAPLAATSTKKWISRLGGRRWQLLHRLVYVSAIAGVIHYLWLVKLDIRYPVRYAIVLGLLLGFRLLVFVRGRLAVQPKLAGARAPRL